ncbi:50S ribosomal protein L29 [Candidatus Woesearchaeota archaeon]|nr:50S ribosomal protein L29 [Candidatus Woesearchaeota archaeon]
MKFKDIASMSDADRKKTVTESKAELIKLNGQSATGTTPKSPGRIKQLKKTIARVLTLENQKQSASSSSKEVDVAEKK